MADAYLKLLLVDKIEDPSEVFNLIDEARRDNPDDPQVIEKCAYLEYQVHELFTPVFIVCPLLRRATRL